MQKKIDYQKINSLKARVYDKMVEVERLTNEIGNLQKECVELNNQIAEEQNKIKKQMLLTLMMNLNMFGGGGTSSGGNSSIIKEKEGGRNNNEESRKRHEMILMDDKEIINILKIWLDADN